MKNQKNHNESELEHFEAYTDGSYKSSIGCGGYSSIITKNGGVVAKLYQGFQNTTNNRQELMGVLETLKFFKAPVSLCIYSDSMYVVGSITQGHVFK